MLATTFDAPTLITTGVIVVIAMVLGYRLLAKDASVRRTRWGIFVERDHYTEEEGEVWTVDPLPPPAPPPALPPTEDHETEAWPQRKTPE